MNNKIIIDQQDKKLMLEILEKYPYQFYVYGSRTKGLAQKYSDIDICYFDDIPQQDINKILPLEKDFIEKELAFLSKNWPLNSLPKGIIHADLFPDNVLFENRKISGIIDFYFSCYDFLAYDLAILVNAWCFSKKNFKQDFYENLIKGYQSVRPLTKNEKKKFNILLRGASMRFLMTRIFDKIHTPKKNNVTIKDPSEYLFKLKFHQSNNDSDAYF